MRFHNSRCLPIAAALLAVTTVSRAQTAFNEVEPNSTKTEATLITGMVAGDTINGTTTGATPVAGDTAITSPDIFRVKTAALPPGIYRHRLTVTTAGTAGHTLNILGLDQTGGVIGTTDIVFQQSTAATGRLIQWYGFGKQEELYVAIAGAAATTSPYVITLSTVSVTPFQVGGCFAAGNITLTAAGQGHSSDTDTWVYDGNFDAIPGYGNDDTVAGTQSSLTRAFTPGDYYYVLSTFDTGNNLPSPMDDDFQDGLVVDFPNILVHNGTAVNTNLRFQISDGTTTERVPATKIAAFDVIWAHFVVSATPCAASSGSGFCFGDFGCPCSNGTTAAQLQGCAFSMMGGATLSSTGVSSVTADTFVLNATNLPFPPGGQGSILLFQGTTQVNTPFNDGKRCVSGTMIRLGVKLHTGTVASYPQAGDALISVKGVIGSPAAVGVNRHYQGHFRTVPMTACGTNSNTTNGVTTVWLP